MTKLFGANWQTTFYGSLFAVCLAIANNATLVAFLPDSIENYVRGIAGLVAAAAGIKFAIEAKSRNVTGGTVQQTTDGSVASSTSTLNSSSIIETKQALPKP